MANSYVVTSLPEYVEQRREELIAKSVMGAKTLDYINLQTGVKGPTALNLIDFDITLQDDACGWNEAGTSTLTQRIIDAKPFRVNMAVCDKSLYGTWAQYQVKVAAGKVASDLPFEQDFVNGVLNGIQERVEELIWQGDKSNAGEFDGFLTILGNATAATGTTKMALVSEAYAALPCEVAGKSDVVIFVSCATFRAWMQELVAANLYHYNPGNEGAMEYMLPGTNVRVIAVPGMADDKAVAGRLSNFFYGTDLESDMETFDLWYSKDNREFRIDVSFIAGVQIAYPSEVAFYTL
jgi:hypothetical protein